MKWYDSIASSLDSASTWTILIIMHKMPIENWSMESRGSYILWTKRFREDSGIKACFKWCSRCQSYFKLSITNSISLRDVIGLYNGEVIRENVISDTVALGSHKINRTVSHCFSSLLPSNFWFHVSFCKKNSSVWQVEMAITISYKFTFYQLSSPCGKEWLTLSFISQVWEKFRLALV